MNLKKIMAFVGFMLLATTSAHAQSVTIGSMFANFQDSALAIIKLIQSASYVIGLFLVAGSIFKFIQMSQSPQVTLKMPLIMFFSGIGIFALTGSISVASQTLAMGSGPGSILLPSSSGLNAATSAAMLGVLTFMRMVGYLAFLRGWLILNQYGQGTSQHAGLGRALTHIGGGVALINITVAAKIIANTIAPGLTMPF